MILEPEDDRNGTCVWCGKVIHWTEDDHRASRRGSYVSPDGEYRCPEGNVHASYGTVSPT